MRVASKLLIALGISTMPAMAMAQWSTTVEDDIFTGGKKATLVVPVSDYDSSNALVFDCTKNDLYFAYVEKSNEPEKVSNLPVDIVVKVDSGEVIKLKAAFSQRNDRYVQAASGDREEIIKILSDASRAKSKVIVGISSDTIGKYSFTVNANGSSKAVSKFTGACEINKK